MKKTIIVTFFLLATLGGCNKNTSTGGQTATLALKDGTTVAGTVTKSDTSSITIQAPNGVVSTYPVSQVASINYGPGSASNPTPGEPAPAASSTTTTPGTAQPPAREYRPAETFQTIPAGRTLAVRTDQSIDSKTAAPGQTYPGVVDRDVTDTGGQVAIPRGSSATLVIRESRGQGKVEGRSELAVDVAVVRVHGRQYRLETSDFIEKGREGLGANKRTAEFAGGGGLFGTIIGAVAGGGKGAAIGALSGAAAGATTQALTRGKGISIPAETVLNFRLEAPIRIREMR
jgi:hypothetical protein